MVDDWVAPLLPGLFSSWLAPLIGLTSTTLLACPVSGAGLEVGAPAFVGSVASRPRLRRSPWPKLRISLSRWNGQPSQSHDILCDAGSQSAMASHVHQVQAAAVTHPAWWFRMQLVVAEYRGISLRPLLEYIMALLTCERPLLGPGLENERCNLLVSATRPGSAIVRRYGVLV